MFIAYVIKRHFDLTGCRIVGELKLDIASPRRDDVGVRIIRILLELQTVVIVRSTLSISGPPEIVGVGSGAKINSCQAIGGDFCRHDRRCVPIGSPNHKRVACKRRESGRKIRVPGIVDDIHKAVADRREVCHSDIRQRRGLVHTESHIDKILTIDVDLGGVELGVAERFVP